MITIHKHITAFVILLVLAWLPSDLYAQVSLTPQNTAMGGGGVSYLTGFEALSVNPANLYVNERDYSLQISLFQAGSYFDTPLPSGNFSDRTDLFFQSFKPYDPADSDRTLDESTRRELIGQNFSDGYTSRSFQAYADIYWAGMKWKAGRSDRNYAFALRTRMSSRYTLHRGLFAGSADSPEAAPADQSFFQDYEVLHELSFGYGESFTFLNGLLPTLSRFLIGIAPKVIMAGSYQKTEYPNRYTPEPIVTGWMREAEYVQQNSGYLSESAERFRQSPGATASVMPEASIGDLLKPAGFGLGLDLGLSYILPLGFSADPRSENIRPPRFLRLGFSVTDLGAVYHYRNPGEYRNSLDSGGNIQPGAASSLSYQGVPDEYLFFLNQEESEHPLSNALLQSGDPFITSLSTSINAGAMLRLNRFSVSSDISYGIVENAFQMDGFTAFIGTELRLLPFLPVRAGTRIAESKTDYYSFGAGIETRYFDVNASMMLRRNNLSPGSEILGASFIGLKVYIL